MEYFLAFSSSAAEATSSMLIVQGQGEGFKEFELKSESL